LNLRNKYFPSHTYPLYPIPYSTNYLLAFSFFALYLPHNFIPEGIMQTVTPESVGLSSTRLERLKSAMQQYVDRGTFAGIVTLISRHEQVAHLGTFGAQDLESGRPMAPDTIFRIYSMTKPITSAAVMILCEEGRLRLCDPLSRYLPEFKDARVMVSRGGADYDLVLACREITLHDLITHSGGIGYGSDEHSALDQLYRETLARIEKEVEPVLEKQVQAFARARLPLAFHPGTGFRYSLSIDLLGYVVQVASGQLFEDFLQERILGPLEMVDTAFWVPPEKAGRLAFTYGPAETGGLKALRPPQVADITQKTRNPSGGGGLVSTVGDYFRFGQMLLNSGELEGARILGRKTVEWMLQNHLPEGILPMNEPANGFGIGGAVLLHPGLSHRPGSIGRFGWGGAANTEWWIDPAEGLQCLLMLQYMPCFTIPIVEDFAQLAYQALE
jgi:CubicO group peptidase (beta-lactamase class C family)